MCTNIFLPIVYTWYILAKKRALIVLCMCVIYCLRCYFWKRGNLMRGVQKLRRLDKGGGGSPKDDLLK